MRGFFAGVVRKKLGLDLRSERSTGPACFLSSWPCLVSRRTLRHRHGSKYRHPFVPISILLVSVRDLEHPGLGERAALDLEPNGQAFAVKPARHAHGRQPHIVDGPRVGGDGAEGLDGSRRARVDIGGGEGGYLHAHGRRCKHVDLALLTAEQRDRRVDARRSMSTAALAP